MEELAIIKPKNEIKNQNKIEASGFELPEQNKVIHEKIETETYEEKVGLVDSKKNEILEMFNDKKNPLIEMKAQIKEGVDFVFEQNPELPKFGTKEQYSKYLDTVFPESKIQNVLYHGGHEKLKDDDFKFDIRRRYASIGKLLQYWGAYFTETPGYAQYHAEKNFKKNATVAVKVDSINPKEIFVNNKTFSNPFKFSHESINTKEYKKLIADGFDSVIARYGFNDPNNDIEMGKIKEFVALESEQIHMLGSKQDMEDFKKFVENNKDSQN